MPKSDNHMRALFHANSAIVACSHIASQRISPAIMLRSLLLADSLPQHQSLKMLEFIILHIVFKPFIREFEVCLSTIHPVYMSEAHQNSKVSQALLPVMVGF